MRLASIIFLGLLITTLVPTSGRTQHRQRAQIVMTPTTMDMGAVRVDKLSPDGTFIVTNMGGMNAGQLSFSLEGVDKNNFEFSPLGTCTPGMTISPGGSCTLVVRFHPPSLGAASATLSASATDGGVTRAVLAGTGATTVRANPPDIQVIPNSQPIRPPPSEQLIPPPEPERPAPARDLRMIPRIEPVPQQLAPQEVPQYTPQEVPQRVEPQQRIPEEE